MRLCVRLGVTVENKRVRHCGTEYTCRGRVVYLDSDSDSTPTRVHLTHAAILLAIRVILARVLHRLLGHRCIALTRSLVTRCVVFLGGRLNNDSGGDGGGSRYYFCLGDTSLLEMSPLDASTRTSTSLQMDGRRFGCRLWRPPRRNLQRRLGRRIRRH